MEMYSRGRRGAPAKGVGRDNRRESSNLSISARKKPSRKTWLFSTKCSACVEREVCFASEAHFVREVCLRHDMRNT